MGNVVKINGSFELSEEAIEAIADAVAARVGGSKEAEKPAAKTKGKAEKPAAKGKASKTKAPAKDEPEAMTQKEFMALCDKVSASTSKKEVTAVLAEFDYKNPKAVDEEDYEEIAEELNALLGDKDGYDGHDDEEEEDEDEDEESEDEDEDDDEEVTAESVKALFAKAKKVDADEAQEILESFDINSVRGLSKLEKEDLEELADELQELIDG